MKKILLFTLGTVLMQAIIAQPTLTSETHALLPGADNPMTLCKYVVPGMAGPNVVWDFSKLETTEKFSGHVKMVLADKNFSEANIELEEFGTSFFFESDEHTVNQVGYRSKDHKTVVRYEMPFVKMVFPFSYGESHLCRFSGEYTYNGQFLADVTGTGEIDADAWGTIILPNNSVYENTVRVKSVKTYTLNYSATSKQTVEVTTYRWYNSFHRYPLLVLTEYTTTQGNTSVTNYQSAYNNDAVSGLIDAAQGIDHSDISLYPNPAKDKLTITCFSPSDRQTDIKIFDMSGKLVQNISALNISAGENQITLSNELSGLKPGSYILHFTSGNHTITRDFVLVK
ncbi:MAG: T9SS type A sorting domain-containing protein [Bacteroidales bacterium]|nr:T9SS type A sorting domain-containing protein [Bacteroidales bacterium]